VFRREGVMAGLEATSRWYFGVPFADAPEAWQPLLERNLEEWRALVTSDDPFPTIAPEAITHLSVPVLLLSGEKSAKGYNGLIDARLEALLPAAVRVVIPAASHEMFLDAPEMCAAALLQHFARS
jgi:pimeloyl-ACP methyl ester carboxylesterase